MNRKRAILAAGAAFVLAGTMLGTTTSGSVAAPAPTGVMGAAAHLRGPQKLPGGFKHLVVIYEENHSFDNLYGRWGKVGRRWVKGRGDADPAHTTQVDQTGKPYNCLYQDDVNLATPPLSAKCHDDHQITGADTPGFDSHFGNAPFRIDRYIHPDDTTCPPPPPPSAPANGTPKGSGEPGGCTRDLVHRFYQEQYQLNGGRQNRYVTGSDAVGLTMGYYDTKALPIYRYLHSAAAPHYVIADHFFQAAFGGSFLNHQWLIAAATPYDTNPASTWTANGPGAKNSVLDANGMPTSYPLYAAGPPVDGDKLTDDRLTKKCSGTPADDYPNACGNWAVNTIQPGVAPHGTGPYLPLIEEQNEATIGDRMSEAGITWNWYSGGWDDAEAGHPGKLFQYHHQPFNYFANYAPGQPGRAHLQDETKFIAAAKTGTLPTVSFVKPYGAENEHPGYASEPNGSDHLVDLVKDVTEGPQGDDTLIVVTYDEFGGQWDHVSPPVVDRWGPGTRIPAMLIANAFRRSNVDHKTYDTTSILAMIERSFGLAPLSNRDKHVRSLGHAVRAGHATPAGRAVGVRRR